MDDVTIVMFTFSLTVGLIFFILGFHKLEEAVKAEAKSRNQLANSAAGFIYFLICMALWFAMGLYWPVIATDTVLASLGWLLLGFALISFGCSFACVGLLLRASVGGKRGGVGLEIREKSEVG